VRRLAAALWSGLWLVALLAGPPWALLALFGDPLPRHPPQQPYLREWIASAAVLLLWTVWLIMLALVGMQIRAAVRRPRMPRLRLADPPEGLLAGLVGAVVTAYATAASRGTVPAAPPPAAAQPAPAAPATTPADATPLGTAPAGAAAGGTRAADRAESGRPPKAHPTTDSPPDSLATHTPGPVPTAVPAAGPAPGRAGGVASAGANGFDTDRIGRARSSGGEVAGQVAGGRAGIALPGGGWVGRDTATAVTAAAGLVWLRRRRRYRPGPPSGADRHDPDLAPLPDTAATIADTVQNPDPDEAMPPDSGRGDAPPGGRGDAGPAAAGPAAQAMLVPPDSATAATLGLGRAGPLRPVDLPAGGVGLSGAGAHDAARGVLTAALLAGGPGHPDLDAQVLTTTADLGRLLGSGAVGHGHPPGLNVFTDLAQLLPVLEEQVLARARAAPDAPDRPDRDPARRSRPRPGLFPPLLLVAAVPADRELARRLAVLLLAPRRLGIVGLLLGTWPHGLTWRVDPDGTIHHPTAPTSADGQQRPAQAGVRLCVLPAGAATDLLSLQAQARPHRHHLHHLTPPPATGPSATVPPAMPPSNAPPRQGPGRPARVLDHHGGDRPLTLRLFGGLRLCHVREPDRPLRLGRATAVQVLLFLAVHRQGATSGQLAAALWPGVRPYPVGRVYAAASALRTAVHRATGVQIMSRVGDRYQLNPDCVRIDLWQLHTAVDQATAATHTGAHTAALHTVIDVYTGELAAGQAAAWLAPHREAARRHVIDAYTTLAAHSDPAAAAALLHEAVRVDPYNEHLHRAAARAYAAAGQPARARPLLTGLARRLADIDDDPPEPAAILPG
jgi:DNA-binding SARP family transcriptional activator